MMIWTKVAAAVGASHTAVEYLANIATQGATAGNLAGLLTALVPVVVAGLEG